MKTYYKCDQCGLYHVSRKKPYHDPKPEGTKQWPKERLDQLKARLIEQGYWKDK